MISFKHYLQEMSAHTALHQLEMGASPGEVKGTGRLKRFKPRKWWHKPKSREDEPKVSVDLTMSNTSSMSEAFKGGGTEAPGAYGKGFPTVHKIPREHIIPHPDKSIWKVAFPGGMEPVEWYTADHPNEQLHPQKTPEGTLRAIGKAESGRKFKMEFRKAAGHDKLCPFDSETWEPVNIRGGTSHSSGEEIHDD